MFKMADMFKNAMAMKKKLEKIQKGLKEMRVEAEVAGGLVKAVADGQQNLLELEIKEELINQGDRRFLEDLVRSAVNEALNKSRSLAQEEMKKALGDLPLRPDQMGI